MSMEALPCVVCGEALRNIEETATNQPYKGTAFTTHGHYGSTSFDPMDGRYLELNLCDKCIVRLGYEGKILLGQSYKPVTMPAPTELGTIRSIIGTTPVERALVTWNPDTEEETEAFDLDSYDEYFEFRDRINSRFTDDEIREMFERNEEKEKDDDS